LEILDEHIGFKDHSLDGKNEMIDAILLIQKRATDPSIQRGQRFTRDDLAGMQTKTILKIIENMGLKDHKMNTKEDLIDLILSSQEDEK